MFKESALNTEFNLFEIKLSNFVITVVGLTTTQSQTYAILPLESNSFLIVQVPVSQVSFASDKHSIVELELSFYGA